MRQYTLLIDEWIAFTWYVTPVVVSHVVTRAVPVDLLRALQVVSGDSHVEQQASGHIASHRVDRLAVPVE